MADDDPEYLDADDVIALHGIVMRCSEQQAARRVRSRSGLDSAIARPISHAAYAGADIATQAAVLAHGIAEAQAVVDGNKRTAWVALRTFLNINGWDVTATQSDRAAWILELSAGGSMDVLAQRVRTALMVLPSA